MALELYKGKSSGTVPTMVCLSSGAITKGDPVILGTQTASTTDRRPIVSTYVGASSSSVLIFGVAMDSVADATEVLVIIPDKDMEFLADAAADCNRNAINADNYLAATTLALTVGASTNQGKKCHVIGFAGLSTARKYIVRLLNTVL